MIDLNKYYVAKTYDGVSGNYAGRPGFVPQATTGDIGKFLRADGTWADVIIPDVNIMSGATSGTNGASGLAPQPLAGDDKKYLRGDGTWSDPTISTIQYIENQNNVTLDIKNYDTFLIKTANSLTVNYANFAIGKSINVYLIADHQSYLPHSFPSNTIFAELGDENTIYSFESYTTRILLQNIGDNVINFSSISVTPASNYYNYNNQGTVGIGVNLINELFQNL